MLSPVCTFRQKYSSQSFFGESRRVFFASETLSRQEKFTQKTEKTVGQKAIEAHERAKNTKDKAKKNPLVHFLSKAPDEDIADADEAHNESLADQVSDAPHAVVSAVFSDNIPPEVGEKIVAGVGDTWS
jgi:hypothetical protein